MNDADAVMMNALSAETVAEFAEEIPCIISLTDEGCNNKAAVFLRMVHRDDDSPLCGSPPGRVPMCNEHKSAMVNASSRFWQAMFGFDKPLCAECGREWNVVDIVPIKGS